MIKEKSKLIRKILPKLTSFLPIGLGINLANYSRKCTTKENTKPKKKFDKYDLQTGIYGEIFRDVPTATLFIFREPIMASAYYALSSYIVDRSISLSMSGK
jgi:hypothetical protein